MGLHHCLVPGAEKLKNAKRSINCIVDAVNGWSRGCKMTNWFAAAKKAWKANKASRAKGRGRGKRV